MIDERAIGDRFRALAGELNERQRRLWAAAEARSHGRGGTAATARATGMHEDTIRKGIRELQSGERLPAGRVRKAGAGRKSLTDSDPTGVVISTAGPPRQCDRRVDLARRRHDPDGGGSANVMRCSG